MSMFKVPSRRCRVPCSYLAAGRAWLRSDWRNTSAYRIIRGWRQSKEVGLNLCAIPNIRSSRRPLDFMPTQARAWHPAQMHCFVCRYSQRRTSDLPQRVYAVSGCPVSFKSQITESPLLKPQSQQCAKPSCLLASRQQGKHARHQRVSILGGDANVHCNNPVPGVPVPTGRDETVPLAAERIDHVSGNSGGRHVRVEPPP